MVPNVFRFITPAADPGSVRSARFGRAARAVRFIASGEEVNIPDAAAIYVGITNYCSAHPLDSARHGSIHLIRELRQRTGLTPSR
jgi:hypothetical protein